MSLFLAEGWIFCAWFSFVKNYNDAVNDWMNATPKMSEAMEMDDVFTMLILGDVFISCCNTLKTVRVIAG